MEIKEHFEKIKHVVLDNLKEAKEEILIAITWFTNQEIFELLIEKAKDIPVHLIVSNDDINNRIDGLNFQEFINNGGNFYFGLLENQLNNKFCIIDRKVLITGSYNFTYLSETISSENILVFKGVSDIVESYRNEFFKLISNLKPIESIKDYLEMHPYQKDTFSYKNYGIRDIHAHALMLKSSSLLDKSNLLLSKIEEKTAFAEEMSFKIIDVIYKQWQLDCYVDKIQVLNNKLILLFKTNFSKGGWIHGPKANHAWVIRNTINKNLLRKSERITNIKIDGNKTVISTEAEEIFHFSIKENEDELKADLGYQINEQNQPITEDGQIVPIKHFTIPEQEIELTCEIHFDIEGFPLETVDLIEGLGTEEKNTHWHIFDINLKLNRENL